MTQPQPPVRPAVFDERPDELESRTYEWARAEVLADAGSNTTGLERMEAIRDGRLPGAPMMYTLGWRLTSVEAGAVELKLTPEAFHLNPYRVHGGVLSTLLDSATACAVITVLALGESSNTLEIKTNFLRSVGLDTGEITCEGRVVHRGRRIAVSEARILDTAERELARASATSLITQPPVSAREPAPARRPTPP